MKKFILLPFTLLALASVSLAQTIVTPDSASANIPGLSGRAITETIDGSGFNTDAADISD